MHTHVHTHRHRHPLSRIPNFFRIRTCDVRAHVCIRTHAHKRTHTHTRTHAHTHTHTHTNTPEHYQNRQHEPRHVRNRHLVRLLFFPRKKSYIFSCSRSHASARTCTHTYATHMHIHTHIHTHTCAQVRMHVLWRVYRLSDTCGHVYITQEGHTPPADPLPPSP